MKVLLLIPARGGSKGMPRKNLARLAGVSLVGHAVAAAREFVRASALSDAKILVDTDSQEIADEGLRWGAAVPFLRPAHLAADDTPTIENVLWAVERLEAGGWKADAVVLLQPTSPLRTAEDIRACWARFHAGKHPSVISVVRVSHPAAHQMRQLPDGVLEWALGDGPSSIRRQDHAAALTANGAVYVNAVDHLRRHRAFIVSGETLGVEMPLGRSVDVDTAEDLDLAGALAAAGTDREPATAFSLGGRMVGRGHPPLVIAEIGINHEGDVRKALRMIDDAKAVGAECVKFQSHVVEDEMIPNDVIPGNAKESIWDIMKRCALSEDEERLVKARVEELGMLYLCTPFSRASADRLETMGVVGYKIGSGECNNYPLIRHIAGFGKPVILSTGMNDIPSVEPAVRILREAGVPFALTHCTSMYPTPYDKVRLGALAELREHFPDAVLGLSDHSMGNYTCFAAVALGARILEKHYTSDKTWPGPDVPISIDPAELGDLVTGSRAIYQALGGRKTILPEEQPTIDFAYASVVTIRDVAAGERFTRDNIWVKRPGTGEILARDFEKILGRTASRGIRKDTQLARIDVAANGERP